MLSIVPPTYCLIYVVLLLDVTIPAPWLLWYSILHPVAREMYSFDWRTLEFETYPSDQRDGAINFDELRTQRTIRWQQARKREAEAIADISSRVAIELEKENTTSSLKAQVAQKKQTIEGYNLDLGKLVVKGTEAQARHYSALSDAVQRSKSQIQAFSR